MNIKQIAEEVFRIESKEIEGLVNRLDSNFTKSINSILDAKGKLIISGMGKSGIIGKKIAATLASTGTPSFFLHPGEAYHGDLGMVEPSDILLLISNSGETDEILKLIPFLKHNENTIISLTGNIESTLATNSTYHISIKVDKEACPLQLAPTSSTTATLVMGDAIAVCLMKLRDFKDENFAKFHPGGTLGKRLLMTVDNVMKKDNLPTCNKQSNIQQIVKQITKGKCGLVVVLEKEKESGNEISSVKGIITDGDIRRAMESKQDEFFQLTADDLMTTNLKTVTPDSKLIVASKLMTNNKINSLVVTNGQNKLLGIIQLYDFEG